MSHFKILKDQFYGRVASSPDKVRTAEVILSDIVLHLPVLEWYASLCDHVTEFGTRNGESTVAFIAGCKGEVHSYDVNDTSLATQLAGASIPCRWHFHKGDTTNPDLGVGETDFLFFDTLHTYAHLSVELSLWGRKAKKFLGFHDTFTCGEVDLSGLDPTARGIMPAIREFMDRHPGEYRTAYRSDCCNGVLILERLGGYAPEELKAEPVSTS